MPPELKLTFNEQPVSDVYQTRLIFFNKGNETILKENVTESITMHFKGANILRQPIIAAKSREGIGMSAKQVIKDGDNAVEVSFQFLDHNDGAVIEIWHTKSEDIEVSGNILGTSRIRYIGEFAPTYSRPRENIILRMIVYIGIPVIATGFFFWPRQQEETQNLPSYFYIIWVVLLCYMIGLGVSPFIRVRRFPRWSVVNS
jgi:hypothetical protein